MLHRPIIPVMNLLFIKKDRESDLQSGFMFRQITDIYIRKKISFM